MLIDIVCADFPGKKRTFCMCVVSRSNSNKCVFHRCPEMFLVGLQASVVDISLVLNLQSGGFECGKVDQHHVSW